MQDFLDSFKKHLLPGNFFLTKSMELSKLEDSGTLWYTKKFIVLYYYIFLNNNITNKNVVKEICAIFDSYINSMPPVLQARATEYFYNPNPTADLRSEKFILFDSFAGSVAFTNSKKEIKYKEMAKKYYMAFLMGSGGQSAVKEYIKDKIYDEDFCFSRVEDIIVEYGVPGDASMTSTKNDFMAFVRNERQILFYYGFFHSKSLGANDREFSSLTPVGKIAIKANYYELIALWEHQKIKMVSQPVTCVIQNIKGLHVDASSFAINRSPYLTILKWLQYRHELNLQEYSCLVSRSINVLTPSQIDKLISHIDEIGETIENFGRKGDKKGSADYLKELKKYILGIWNLREDQNSNPFAFCEYYSRRRPSVFTVTNQAALSTLISIYTLMDSYKLKEYEELFKAGEEELRQQYKIGLTSSTNSYKINPRVKIDWDLYNIHVDPTIMSGVLVALMQIKTGKEFKKENVGFYLDNCFSLFSNVLKFLGVTKNVFKKMLIKLLSAIEQNNSEVLMSSDKREMPAIEKKEYSEDKNEGTLVKIMEESAKETVNEDGERKRNFTLISLIRAYNNAVHMSEGQLLCECCHQPTFLTERDKSYYFEYHHLIPFSICEGPDHYLNIYALCPMCHMKMHHMMIADKGPLYNDLATNNYLHKTIEERLEILMKSGKLTSYHLEYLLADNAITNEQYERLLA